MRVLLDTCTFLWAVWAAPDLSPAARALIEDPDNDVFLSVVSGWEIAVKHGLGRLRLPADPWLFIPAERARRRIESLPLLENAVLTLPRLPALHQDPFDRMLVCQAVAEGLTILTPDPLVRAYPVLTAW